ncbi:MAG: hypothetical protein AAGB24_14815 [Bacteroidota bacterium]
MDHLKFLKARSMIMIGALFFVLITITSCDSDDDGAYSSIHHRIGQENEMFPIDGKQIAMFTYLTLT